MVSKVAGADGAGNVGVGLDGLEWVWGALGDACRVSSQGTIDHARKSCGGKSNSGVGWLIGQMGIDACVAGWDCE